MKKIQIIIVSIIAIYAHSCAQSANNEEKNTTPMNSTQNLEIATFGSGCFWCTEAVFERLEGVDRVVSGYSGGHIKNPTYKEVCTATTGHAEVCQIYFDPSVITYEELLDVFWHTHDPTTLNKQGNDVGPQYRSVIFYHNDKQKQLAEASKLKMDESGAFADPVVTEIIPLEIFYEAEDYHQEYFEKNPNQPYCTFVVAPKVKKFTAKYPDKLK